MKIVYQMGTEMGFLDSYRDFLCGITIFFEKFLELRQKIYELFTNEANTAFDMLIHHMESGNIDWKYAMNFFSSFFAVHFAFNLTHISHFRN